MAWAGHSVEAPAIERVLVVHNAYQQPGGEDAAVSAEVALLRAGGVQVEEYRRHNDEVETISRFSLARQTLWSRRTTTDVQAICARFNPRIVHVHNTFPLVSPSLYWTAREAGVPVVQTIHNFRLVCPQGMLLRDERPCEDCLGSFPWRAIVHRCYRQSAVQSGVLACTLGLHRAIGTFEKAVTRYIALSEFSRDKLVEGGLPAARISVKPNCTDIPLNKESTRSGGLFVGRLSREKGLAVLRDAVERIPGLEVRVVGDGPEARELADTPSLIPLGWRARDDVISEMRRAAFLVLPSLCYENFPLVLVEAFACGLPVIASRRGAMAELIEDGRTGLLFDAGSVEDLADKLRVAATNPALMLELGRNARQVYEARYTPQANFDMLTRIYGVAISEGSRGPTA